MKFISIFLWISIPLSITIYIFPLFVFIGLVLGPPGLVFLAFLPWITFVLCVWRISWEISLSRDRRFLTSVAIAAAILCLPPLILNVAHDWRMSRWTAEDIAKPYPVPSGRTIALAVDELGTGDCYAMCRRLLLTGAASRVLVPKLSIEREPLTDPLSFSKIEMISYELASTPLAPHLCVMPREGDTQDRVDPKEHESWILLAKAALGGHCLLKRDSTPKEADFLLAERRLMQTSEWLGEPGIRRLSLFKNDGVTWTEPYRRTAVSYMRLAPVLLPYRSGGSRSDLNGSPSWFRLERQINSYKINGSDRSWIYPPTEIWAATVKDIFSIDLAIQAADNRQLASDVVSEIIGLSGLIPGYAPELIGRLLPDGSRPEAVIAFLNDRTLPIDGRSLEQTIHYMVSQKAPQIYPLTELIFKRLREIIEALPQSKQKSEDNIRALSFPIFYLPRDVILANRSNLFWLAGHPERFQWTAYALSRLSEFGGDGLPHLITVVEDMARSRWDSEAVIRSICRMGPTAHSAVPSLLDLLKGPQYKQEPETIVAALLALGVEKDEIKSTMLASGDQPERVDKALDRAKPAQCR